MIYSPDKSDVLKIGKRGTLGKNYTKHLHIPVSEIYQDKLQSEENGVLPEV